MKASLKTVSRRRGLTLLEMVLVLGILAVVAGVITYSITPTTLTFSGVGNNETAAHIATRATMKSIQGALLGDQNGPGYWSDMNKNSLMFPQSLADLFVSPGVTSAAYSNITYNPYNLSIQQFWSYNPKTGLGWRGPYLAADGKYIYGAAAEARYFSNNFQLVSLSKTPCPTDGWGNPIVLWPGGLVDSTSLPNACLISAGPNGILDSNSPTAHANLHVYNDFVTARLRPSGDPLRYCQDDVIVFLFQPALP